MSTSAVAVIVLAAGKGTRMKSSLHKVLHPVAGRPMLGHLLETVAELSPERQVIVVGDEREQVEAWLADHDVVVAVQDRQLGTGHAVQQAAGHLKDFDGRVLILYGDVPMVRPDTLRALLDRLEAPDAPLSVVLTFSPEDAKAYGRVLTDGGQLITKMVEFKDATAEERSVNRCNSGILCVRSADLWSLLGEVRPENAAGEYYLPDIVMIGLEQGRRSAVIEAENWEVAGVNSRVELAAVEAEWQRRRRQELMEQGVTMIAPDTVWFSHDTVVGRDVTIEPNVVFGPGVVIADGAIIRAFSHIEGARIDSRAEIGPFARLRPGAVIGEEARIGNFVEVKQATLGPGAKANHLTYLGDAEVGANANVGAGTITCNYDGFLKYRTTIGEGAFIGSNSALVAPVTIGKGAMVAAGSVVTHDVGADALAISRNMQEVKPGWAASFRAVMSARKRKKG